MATLNNGDSGATARSIINSKQDSLGFTAENSSNKDTDGTLAANSDTKYASQKATKTYVDANVTPDASTSTKGKAKLYTSIGSNTDGSMDQSSITSALSGKQDSLGFTPEDVSKKDATGGYAGLTLFNINFKNALNTFTSFFTNSNTAARTYTFPDKDLTVVGTVDVIGLQDLFVPATAMWPRVTNGCADLSKTEMVTSLVNIQTLDFDPDTQTYAQFGISLPRNWNNGTVTAKIYWMAATGSGDVKWQIKGGAYSDNDLFTVALGTAQSVTDTLLAASKLQITSATSAITLAGSPADSDMLFFEISRVAADGADTLTSNAKLIGVVITITTDAAVAS